MAAWTISIGQKRSCMSAFALELSLPLALSLALLLTSCDSTNHSLEPINSLSSSEEVEHDDSSSNVDKNTELLKIDGLRSDKPSGYLAPEAIAPKLKYPVNDFTNTLSAAERVDLDHKIQTIHHDGVLQIGIVVLHTTAEIPIYDYAMTVAKSWGLGSPNNNNGLLMLVAVEDRQIYILTGLDIEDKLTDERVAMVIDTYITPAFAKQNYAQGLSKAIEVFASEMRGSE